MSQVPPTIPQPRPNLRPHRGVMILIFGILSFVLSCFVFGILAWVMGNGDLRAMRAGQMDPSGEGLTQAGRILGIINICLLLAVIAFYVVFLIIIAIVGVAAAGAGAAGGGGP